MNIQEITRLAKLVHMLTEVTAELESVWSSIGQTSPNRHAVAARGLLDDLCRNVTAQATIAEQKN